MLEANADHDAVATRKPARPRRTREVYVDGIGAVPLKDLMTPREVRFWTGHSETWLRRDRQRSSPRLQVLRGSDLDESSSVGSFGRR